MASSGPTPKRLRLSLPSNPSLPSTHSSPFLDSPNDVINQIFCWITNEKEKFCLEQICTKFQLRLKDRISWKFNRKLRLYLDGQTFKINGFQFNEEKAPKALGVLLERMKVEYIVFKKINNSVPESLIWKMVSKFRTHIDSFHLKKIQYEEFDSTLDSDRNAIFTNILAFSDLSNVKTIQVSFLRQHSLAFYCSFWTLVQGCRESLVSLICDGMKNDLNTSYYSDVVTGFPSLHSLAFPPAFSDDDIARVAVMCNSLNRLTTLQLFVSNHSQFVQLLDNRIKSNIRSYTVFMFKSGPMMWENHNKSLQMQQQLTEKINQRIDDKIKRNEGTWIDWQYLYDAAKLLTKCRYSLQYTYPYAFYFEPGHKKELFEYQQAMLEKEIEELSWKVERAELFDRAALEGQMNIAEKKRLTLLESFLK